jgi:hypothetical protein
MPSTRCPALLIPPEHVEVRVLVRRHLAAGVWIKAVVMPVDDRVLGLLRLLPVEVVDTVRARELAVTAPDAAVSVGEDETVFPLEPGANGADLHARCVVTVLARPGKEAHLRVRVCSLLEPEDVHPEVALNRVVLDLAGGHASTTPLAPVEVDSHCVLGHQASPPFVTFTFTWND